MYSVVLATMLTAGGAAPDWHGCHGCHGCWGCSCSCSCYGCNAFSCHGCWGCSCHGCWGCSCGGCWGWCCGGSAVSPYHAHPPVAPAPAPAPAPKKADAGSAAHIIVRLPADAKLSVDGVDCPLTSDTRSFDSPALQPGQKYFYTFKAEVVRDGKTRTESKRVIIAAGEKVNVEFNLPVETASR